MMKGSLVIETSPSETVISMTLAGVSCADAGESRAQAAKAAKGKACKALARRTCNMVDLPRCDGRGDVDPPLSRREVCAPTEAAARWARARSKSFCLSQVGRSGAAQSRP